MGKTGEVPLPKPSAIAAQATPQALQSPVRREPRAHRQGAGASVYSGPIIVFLKDFPMKRLSALFATVALASLLAACGQKGPLYLPDTEQQPAAEHAH